MTTYICMAIAEEIGRAWREVDNDAPGVESVRAGFARAREIVTNAQVSPCFLARRNG